MTTIASSNKTSSLAASPSLGKIVTISLSILMLGLAIAWVGFFLTQY